MAFRRGVSLFRRGFVGVPVLAGVVSWLVGPGFSRYDQLAPRISSTRANPLPWRKLPSIMTKQTELLVGGRRLPVSNLDKVFYPKTGFTKGQVIEYYIQVAPVLLPHLKDRPLTLKRYPNGVEGPFFYEKRCPAFRPSWFKTAKIWSE